MELLGAFIALTLMAPESPLYKLLTFQSKLLSLVIQDEHRLLTSMWPDLKPEELYMAAPPPAFWDGAEPP